ncbi:MAG: cyclic nucleotide-binding domain-containing protein [Actinobacteria bacterium]|nr:cyclic nucleotide-binding domain-containing protein [Actinomycetota bacterium]
MSPRESPATAHELARVELLAGLPGELLTRLAARMRREGVAPGQAVVLEGEPGERFYVVLSGVLAVSQTSLGPRRLLRAGDSFGEVALALSIPRTASVRALVPSALASCDRAAFDEFVRPLLADDGEAHSSE